MAKNTPMSAAEAAETMIAEIRNRIAAAEQARHNHLVSLNRSSYGAMMAAGKGESVATDKILSAAAALTQTQNRLDEYRAQLTLVITLHGYITTDK